MIELSTEIAFRADFSLLCNARGYKDAVEVGTDLGVFAAQFMSRWNGHWLYCVDPYEPVTDFPYNRIGDLAVAALAMAPYHGRVRFVRARSTEAVRWINRLITPEFVYIDGAHTYDEVAADLRAWWQILPPHGMLAGHDHDLDHPDVIEAVGAFAQEHSRLIRLTHEPITPSWYIYRTEPVTLVQKFFRDGEIPNDHA